MAGLSNIIEEFLLELLRNTSDGVIEIGRRDVATKFNCAPSQINYVLSTRFTPYKGYYIESRRGEGGYIKIVESSLSRHENFTNILMEEIGESLSCSRAYDIVDTMIKNGLISEMEGLLIKTGVNDSSLSKVSEALRDKVRSNILMNLLLVINR